MWLVVFRPRAKTLPIWLFWRAKSPSFLAGISAVSIYVLLLLFTMYFTTSIYHPLSHPVLSPQQVSRPLTTLPLLTLFPCCWRFYTLGLLTDFECSYCISLSPATRTSTVLLLLLSWVVFLVIHCVICHGKPVLFRLPPSLGPVLTTPHSLLKFSLSYTIQHFIPNKSHAQSLLCLSSGCIGLF